MEYTVSGPKINAGHNFSESKDKNKNGLMTWGGLSLVTNIYMVINP